MFLWKSSRFPSNGWDKEEPFFEKGKPEPSFAFDGHFGEGIWGLRREGNGFFYMAQQGRDLTSVPGRVFKELVQGAALIPFEIEGNKGKTKLFKVSRDLFSETRVP